MAWQGGVFVALASSLVANLGSLWRQRGAAAAPEVDIRRPIATVVGLFRVKWWTIGYVAAFVAWLLHVGALAITPLSIVQASLATGFIFLGLLADRFFGFELGSGGRISKHGRERGVSLLPEQFTPVTMQRPRHDRGRQGIPAVVPVPRGTGLRSRTDHESSHR